VILVDGVERWRQAEVERHLLSAIREIPPGTTLALFAREDARAKAPAALGKAVEDVGGQVVAQMTVKPWKLAQWTREQAARMGLALDVAAAQALVDQVGERQQRLLRELEKLALSIAADGARDSSGRVRVGIEEIGRDSTRSAQLRAYSLADALVGGDARQATLAYLRLRGQGERLSGLSYLMAQRLREALAIALRLRAGDTRAEVRRGLHMPPRAAERFVADVARSDPDRLRRALRELADLEIDSRGGAPAPWSRSPGERSAIAGRSLAALDEDTLGLLAIEAITAER
jgi:DNA polymerase III subunit delta